MKILRDLRKRAGLTLREVEKKTSISNAYLSQLETGSIKSPSAQALHILARLYGTTVEMLLTESGYVKKTVRPVKMKPTIDHRIDDLEKRVAQLENHLLNTACKR